MTPTAVLTQPANEYPSEPPAPMARAFFDYLQCPEDIVRFEVADHLSADSGFFTLGNSAVCYGQCAGPSPTAVLQHSMPDVSGEVRIENGTVILPFDLSQIVDNLRYERYRINASGPLQRFVDSRYSRDIYYSLRPYLSIGIRKHLQRACFRGWKHILFPRWPVDITVDTLMRQFLRLALRAARLEKIPFIWFWPDGAQSCTIVTHDVETAGGRDFCGSLLDIDDSFAIQSSFQIIPAGRYQHADRLVEEIRRRGFEVNVHDLNHDGRLFRDRREFLRRARLINEHIERFGSHGFRSGAMYRNQAWFGTLHISYDMSVPNVAHLEPQGGGCCTVMPYFVGEILELPLTTVQDYSLFHILGRYSVDLWKRQIELIREHNGLISLLSHPDYLVDARARDVYRELLGHIHELREDGSTWIALPGEVDRWWRARQQMVLVQVGRSWRIEGPERHRARLAYASLENDRVVFKVEQAA